LCQCLKHIGYSDDAGFERNVDGSGMVGVSGAVDAFVMLGGPQRDSFQPLDVAQDV